MTGLNFHGFLSIPQADVLALALLSYKLQELDLFNSVEHFTSIVELQYYCQVSLGIALLSWVNVYIWMASFADERG